MRNSWPLSKNSLKLWKRPLVTDAIYWQPNEAQVEALKEWLAENVVNTTHAGNVIND